MVPFHALAQLHEEIRRDRPPPYANLWEAYKELLPTVWKQRSDPTYFVQRPIRRQPESAPASVHAEVSAG